MKWKGVSRLLHGRRPGACSPLSGAGKWRIGFRESLDWSHRNTERFVVGPIAQTKRLAIILTQKEHCADWRLIEALEKQGSRKTRSIILEHERRDFVEPWRAFYNFVCTMYELLHSQQMPPEVLQARRSVILRLEALEQSGITPTSEHYGLEQHFCVDWRRCRTYPSRTRLPSEDAGKHEDEVKVNSRPAWGMSRTRAHMYHGIRHRNRPNPSGAQSSSPVQLLDVEGLEHKESEDYDSDVFIDDCADDDEDGQKKPAAAVAVVVAVKEADPPQWHW